MFRYVGVPKDFNILNVKNLSLSRFFMIALCLCLQKFYHLFVITYYIIYKSERNTLKIHSFIRCFLLLAFITLFFLLIPHHCWNVWNKVLYTKNKTITTLFYGLCICFFFL
jgi:ABC-type bacteriocin/lantibiotic exporter with double-glycine peptidase domain